MSSRVSAKRYAQAIFEIAMERDSLENGKSLDGWGEDLSNIVEVLRQPELSRLLRHAKVSLQKKIEVIREIFPDVGDMARNFLGLVVSQGSVEDLPRVEEEYWKLVDEHRGIERVKVYSAVKLGPQEEARIRDFVHKMTGSTIVLQMDISPSIIGGLVIRIGDKLIDGSAKLKLESLRRDLESAPLVYSSGE